MLGIFLLGVSLVLSLVQSAYKKHWNVRSFIKTFLGYILLINVGLTGLMGAYAHFFKGPEIARLIGWLPGSPFQLEVAVANLSYGVLGVLAFWIRGRFWDAVILGWSIFLLGCFALHLHDYISYDNTAPYNIGLYIWVYDLALPLITLGMLFFLRVNKEP